MQDRSLARCSLKEAGIDPLGVEAFLKEASRYEMHSFMLARHGKVAFECYWAPYGPERPHLVHSFTKGLTATAVGILEGEGRLGLDDPVLSFFPEYHIEENGSYLGRMTIRHLLTMTCGHETEASRVGCDDPVEAFLRHPCTKEPGTHFFYNSMGTTVLGAIVKRVTGQNLFSFLQLRVFDPLGIQGISCDSCPSGIDQAGGGGHLKTEDMAKIALLYLQDGVWEGRRILPEGWVDHMSGVQFAGSSDRSHPDWEDWRQGYGFQVWRCAPPDAFRFDGLYGQFGIVLKEYDTVLVTTCGETDTQGLLRLMWKYILPALGRGDALAEVSEGREARKAQDIRQMLEMQGFQEIQENHEVRLRDWAGGLKIRWKMEHAIPQEKAKACLERFDGLRLLFPDNRESVLPRGRVLNCYTSSWTEKKRNGIRSLAFTLRDGSLSMEYEDNQNHGALPVGTDGDWKEGLLHSLWGDYVMLSNGKWLDGECFQIRLQMAEGEYYQVMEIRLQENAEALVDIWEGPYDRQVGVPEARRYACEII